MYHEWTPGVDGSVRQKGRCKYRKCLDSARVNCSSKVTKASATATGTGIGTANYCGGGGGGRSKEGREKKGARYNTCTTVPERRTDSVYILRLYKTGFRTQKLGSFGWKRASRSACTAATGTMYDGIPSRFSCLPTAKLNVYIPVFPDFPSPLTQG